MTPEWESIKVLTKDEAKTSGVEINRLRDIGSKISHLPKDMEFHRLIRKIFEARSKAIETGVGIDWVLLKHLLLPHLFRMDIMSGSQDRMSKEEHSHIDMPMFGTRIEMDITIQLMLVLKKNKKELEHLWHVILICLNLES